MFILALISSSFGDLTIFCSLSARNLKNLFIIGMSIHLSHVHLKVLGLEPPFLYQLSEACCFGLTAESDLALHENSKEQDLPQSQGLVHRP